MCSAILRRFHTGSGFRAVSRIFAKGGQTWVIQKEGAQLQAVSGGALEKKISLEILGGD